MEINSQQHKKLLELMETLIEDYEANKILIDLFLPIIEKHEATDDRFSKFNKTIDALNQGEAMLRVIMDQHGLALSDFENEIGNEYRVVQVLTGKHSLTPESIKALSERFDIPQAMFIN